MVIHILVVEITGIEVEGAVMRHGRNRWRADGLARGPV